MKSKAEILDIIYHCINRGQCPDCPLFSDEDCTIHIFSALNTLLNKSDFEVMKEILDRSKLNAIGDVGYYNEFGHNIIGISGIGVDIEFDSEGNIL